MMAWGRCLFDGIGVMRDEELAVQWWTKAARGGEVDAMVALAVASGTGRGMGRDQAVSARWWRKAAHRGCRVAMLVTAANYEMGMGVQADPIEAEAWYVKVRSGLDEAAPSGGLVLALPE